MIVIVITACQKEEIKPSKPDPKEKLINCKMCEGHWDLTDTIPKKLIID